MAAACAQLVDRPVNFATWSGNMVRVRAQVRAMAWCSIYNKMLHRMKRILYCMHNIVYIISAFYIW